MKAKIVHCEKKEEVLFSHLQKQAQSQIHFF